MVGDYLRSGLGDDAKLLSNELEVGLLSFVSVHVHITDGRWRSKEDRRTYATIGGMSDARDKEFDLLAGVDFGSHCEVVDG